jgi:hypothetical protein
LVIEPTKEPSSAELKEYLGQNMSSHLECRLEKIFPQRDAISKSEVLGIVDGALNEVYGRFLTSFRIKHGPPLVQEGPEHHLPGQMTHRNQARSSFALGNGEQDSGASPGSRSLGRTSVDPGTYTEPNEWLTALEPEDMGIKFDFSCLDTPAEGNLWPGFDALFLSSVSSSQEEEAAQ